MGSKGRIPPPHLRRPVPGPGIGHPDPFVHGIRPPYGALPPFDVLPPPEIMEQKLTVQHLEMEKLVTENKRFAATHGTLRQELATIQHELEMLHHHAGAVKAEKDQQIVGLRDTVVKMEAELQNAEPLKMDLQQARAEVKSLLAAREELVSRVRHLTEDHQRAHMDLQQIPALMSELESLRQEYQHCRATYDYDKKFYNDHLESLQLMEKNYAAMAAEVEKLRAELKKYSDVERTGGPHGGFTGYNENDPSGQYSVGQNAFGDSYGGPKGRMPLPGSTTGSTGTAADGGNTTPVVAQSGSAPTSTNYDGHRGGPGVSGYSSYRPPGHNGVYGYEANRAASGSTYDTLSGNRGGSDYDAQRRANFEAQMGYEANRELGSYRNFDSTKGGGGGGGGGGRYYAPPPRAASGGP